MAHGAIWHIYWCCTIDFVCPMPVLSFLQL
jgi:hypothetical protein